MLMHLPVLDSAQNCLGFWNSFERSENLNLKQEEREIRAPQRSNLHIYIYILNKWTFLYNAIKTLIITPSTTYYQRLPETGNLGLIKGQRLANVTHPRSFALSPENSRKDTCESIVSNHGRAGFKAKQI